MVRLFLKFYGVLIATLLLSFMLQVEVMDWVYMQLAPHATFSVRFQPTFALLDVALRDLPPTERTERFAQLSREFAIPARLAPIVGLPEASALSLEQRATLDSGALVALERPSGFTMLRRLAGSDQVVALELPGVDNARLKFVSYALNWTIEFTLVAILVLFWVRPLWRELRSLSATAAAIGTGRFEARAVTGRISVLGPVAAALNAMAGQVSSLLQSHRSLTSAVSHELRTPIARLRFSHSLALEAPSLATKDALLARMEADIDQLDGLTTELLDYARMERGTPRLAWQTVPVDPWLEDVLADVRSDPGPPVSIQAQVDLPDLCCEPRYMARALVNLLRNARTHARSQVAVRVHREIGQVVIDVEDDGPGIPAAERERLFEPFTRLDDSRDRHSGGFGLGLAIVRQVARWHGGDARIGESRLGGARISIAWGAAI